MATAPILARPTRDRILEAAFEDVSERGLSGSRVERVAERAGVSRQTVYRYFPSRDDLRTALLLREEERLLEAVRAAVAAAGTLEEAIEESLGTALRIAREHPLLQRLLRLEPETVLPYLTTRSGPILDRAREVVTELLRDRAPRASGAVVAAAADAAVRLVVSHAIAPREDPAAAARALTRILTPTLERRTR